MVPVEIPSRRSTLATLLLACLLAWLLITRPALRGQGENHALIVSLGVLAALCVLYVAEWLVHGLLPAVVAAGMFLAAPRADVGDTFASFVVLNELIFLASLGLILLI